MLVAALLCCATPLVASPQRQASPSAPEKVIRQFYVWYVGAVVSQRDPLRERRGELQRYATGRLIQEIEKMRKGPDGLDGDYFLDAQDLDQAWGRNITVSHVLARPRDATADVRLRGRSGGGRNLHVTLVQEQGTWKVDKVEGR